MHNFAGRLASIAIFSTSILLSNAILAEDNTFDTPLLIIGASYDNGATPIHDDLSGPLFGFAVNSGSYLSIGAALQRSPLLNGFVINEAQAGATTFSRVACAETAVCGTAGWQGFDVQLQKILMRVAAPDPQTPGNVLFNADYVLIGLPNDCLHSSAFGVPDDESSRCDATELNDVVDRIKNVALQVSFLGMTPVIETYPEYNRINLPLTQAVFGFQWVIDEAGFTELRELHRSRLQAEVPGAIVVDDLWEGFMDVGDGLHPDKKTAEKAARKIALALNKHYQATQDND